MTKTVCDICGKEMPTSCVGDIKKFKFAIATNGRVWDICNECRTELNEWLKSKKGDKADAISQ